MDAYTRIKQQFEAAQDPKKAKQMAGYMRNQFVFYGLPTPIRKTIYNDFIKTAKQSKHIDWTFLDTCYQDEHREFQYLVYDYLLALKKYTSYNDLPKLKGYITTKSWWDTIDFLCKIVGDIGLRDQNVKSLMIKWSDSSNIWIRRTAILHQLAYKEKTDTELLKQILVHCMGSDEFFINKAIGWALRQYSKTDPVWVRQFIDEYQDALSSLSIKEAGKYL